MCCELRSHQSPWLLMVDPMALAATGLAGLVAACALRHGAELVPVVTLLAGVAVWHAVNLRRVLRLIERREEHARAGVERRQRVRAGMIALASGQVSSLGYAGDMPCIEDGKIIDVDFETVERTMERR